MLDTNGILNEQAYLVAGLSGGFLTFFLSVFMVPAWISFCLLTKCFGHRSLKYFLNDSPDLPLTSLKHAILILKKSLDCLSLNSHLA